MANEMGIFRTRVGIESHQARGDVRFVDDVMVDTGSELTWLPAPLLESIGVTREGHLRFRMADGTEIVRGFGYGIVHAGGARVSDDVVFANPGDATLLGARTIEGLNFKVDLANKRFVHAGPMMVAAA